MPRLRDIPIAIRKVGALELGKRVMRQVYEDDLLVWASALAYSWLFALFPFLIFLLTLLPYIPEAQKQQVHGTINDFLKQLPTESAATLREWVDRTIFAVLNQTHRNIMSIGLAVALWVASSGMSVTMTALDRCYDVNNGRSFLKHRAIAIAADHCHGHADAPGGDSPAHRRCGHHDRVVQEPAMDRVPTAVEMEDPDRHCAVVVGVVPADDRAECRLSLRLPGEAAVPVSHAWCGVLRPDVGCAGAGIPVLCR